MISPAAAEEKPTDAGVAAAAGAGEAAAAAVAVVVVGAEVEEATGLPNVARAEPKEGMAAPDVAGLSPNFICPPPPLPLAEDESNTDRCGCCCCCCWEELPLGWEVIVPKGAVPNGVDAGGDVGDEAEVAGTGRFTDPKVGFLGGSGR